MATRTSTTELTLAGRVMACLAALATGAAWIGDDGDARLAAAMLLAPLLIDFVLKPRGLQHTELQLAPRRTSARAVFTERVTVRHRGLRTLRDCVLSEPRTMRMEPGALLPPLRPDTPTEVRLRCCSPTRSHQLERVFELISLWPLGLFRARAVVPVATALITEPARVPLAARTLHALAETAAPRHFQHGAGSEFHSLREHQFGEDARGVHALRSAALGTLVRRITTGRLPETVGLVLDLRRAPARTQQGQPRFEWSLGACATLVHLLRERAARVHVLLLDAEPTAMTVQGPAQETELLTLLAEASPAAFTPAPGELVEAMQRLAHCFWIPAGGNHGAPEYAALRDRTTLVTGELA